MSKACDLKTHVWSSLRCPSCGQTPNEIIRDLTGRVTMLSEIRYEEEFLINGLARKSIEAVKEAFPEAHNPRANKLLESMQSIFKDYLPTEEL